MTTAPQWLSRGRGNVGPKVLAETSTFVAARAETTARDLAIRYGLSIPAAERRLAVAAEGGLITDLGAGKYGPLTATSSPGT